MSSNARLALVAVIIAAVVIGGFFLSAPHAREVRVSAVRPAAPSTTPAVSIKDSYKKGVHTLTGSVTAPDACVTVSANATFATSSETQEIDLDLSMPATDGLCLTVATEAPFKTTVSAPAGIPVVVRVNGAPATTTP